MCIRYIHSSRQPPLQNVLREARAGRSSRINAPGVDPTALARAANATRACGDGTDASRGDGGRGDGCTFRSLEKNEVDEAPHRRNLVFAIELCSVFAPEGNLKDSRARLRAREASA